MNVSNHLFLGGSAHGKLITVSNKANEWKVALPVGHLPIENRVLDYEMYVRAEVVTERRSYWVYVRLGEDAKALVANLTTKQQTALKMTIGASHGNPERRTH